MEDIKILDNKGNKYLVQAIEDNTIKYKIYEGKQLMLWTEDNIKDREKALNNIRSTWNCFEESGCIIL